MAPAALATPLRGVASARRKEEHSKKCLWKVCGREEGLFKAGKSDGDMCRACGMDSDTDGRRFWNCSGLTNMPTDGDLLCIQALSLEQCFAAPDGHEWRRCLLETVVSSGKALRTLMAQCTTPALQRLRRCGWARGGHHQGSRRLQCLDHCQGHCRRHQRRISSPWRQQHGHGAKLVRAEAESAKRQYAGANTPETMFPRSGHTQAEQLTQQS